MGYFEITYDINLGEHEAKLLVEGLNKVTTRGMMDAGMSHEQAELLFAIYSKLANALEDAA